MIVGRNDSTGPVPALINELPQPHWKTATTSPKEAPAAKMFIAAAVKGMTMLRKATINNRHPSRTITPTNNGIFDVKTWAKSTKIAVSPPT